MSPLNISCEVCGSSVWHPLPDPSYSHSATTSGIIINRPLGKSQCHSCGLIQLIFHDALGYTSYYKEEYKYYDKVGAEVFSKSRYESLARWVTDNIIDLSPQNILDVGCGRGWAMQEMKVLHSNAAIKGIEPTAKEAELARKAGFETIEFQVGDDENSVHEQFDLIYANNVLQHTTSPTLFLSELKNLLKPNGNIIITIPDALNPDIELLMGDQPFSFIPSNIVQLAKNAGLVLVHHEPNPAKNGLRNEHLFVLKSNGTQVTPNNIAIDSLYFKRAEYLLGWRKVDSYLMRSIAKHARIINFGAGLFSYLLATYCPEYWKRVDFCMVDNFEGMCIDKIVHPTTNIYLDINDAIVFGTNPEIQSILESRFNNSGIYNVSWGHILYPIETKI